MGGTELAENASVTLRAVVCCRLMMNDFSSWDGFLDEYKFATRVSNRKQARSVGARIGKSYGMLKSETTKFIEENFESASATDLIRIADDLIRDRRIFLPLKEFEDEYLRISNSVKYQLPVHSFVSVSLWGLQFDYPEHNFINDLKISIVELDSVSKSVNGLAEGAINLRSDRASISTQISKQKFFSRCVVTAAYNFLEAYIAGLLFEAHSYQKLGNKLIDESFREKSSALEKKSLKEKIERLNSEVLGANSEIGGRLSKVISGEGKTIRDAIHHATAFPRGKMGESGRIGRLQGLKPIQVLGIAGDICVLIKILDEVIWEGSPSSHIGNECGAILDLIHKHSLTVQ